MQSIGLSARQPRRANKYIPHLKNKINFEKLLQFDDIHGIIYGVAHSDTIYWYI